MEVINMEIINQYRWANYDSLSLFSLGLDYFSHPYIIIFGLGIKFDINLEIKENRGGIENGRYGF